MPALDGLRGLAALAVVVNHLGLVLGLPILYLGFGAVMVFFVLSGFVLARTPESWVTWYAARVVRLYVPVLAALGLGVVLLIVCPREHVGSWWVSDNNFYRFSWSSLTYNATLLRPDAMNTSLWSLRWEVLFSALLPLYLVAARWLRRFPFAVTVAVMGLLIAVGYTEQAATLEYLPVFGVGVVLATHQQAPRFGLPASLSRAAARWLGDVSYSLYLIQAPIIVAAATVLPAVPAVAVAAPLCLLTATAFHRLVESPSRRLSRRIAGNLGVQRRRSDNRKAQTFVPQSQPHPSTCMREGPLVCLAISFTETAGRPTSDPE